ncbi:MAG: LamG-like jellyroll fold domain-containing protein [Vicinamibacterales bacterium]
MIAEALEGPPTISNNDLFSARSSLPNVLQPTGAFAHTVRLEVPPGRNGLTPELALQYNSQALEDGIVGYGWSLSIPYIERLNKTGVNRLYEDDFFTTSMGGELATTSANGDYRLRFDDGSFTAFTFFGNAWTAYDKKGTKYTFGATTTAQLYATTTPADIYRWMLEEVRDTNDNYITFEYERDTNTNQIYPKEIRYTGSGSTDGIFKVIFTRETRPDPIISYKTGFKVETRDRVATVTAYVNNTWVRKYELDYATGVNGARSLLSSVQQIGQDESSNQLTMPPETFGYSSSTPGYEEHTNKQIYNAAWSVGDVDGNGLVDRSLFLQSPMSVTARAIDKNFYPSFSSSNTSVSTEYWAYESSDPGGYRAAERGVRFIDANGDGRADILRSTSNDGSPIRSYEENVGGSWIGGSMATSAIPTFANNFTNGIGEFAYSAGIFGNVNGDGLVDYVLALNACGDGGCDTNGTYLNQGTTTGWSRVIGAYAPVETMPTAGDEQKGSILVDVNGDGLDDWMQSGSASTVFYLNTGADWASTTEATSWRIATSTRHANGWDRGIRFFDLNGDGLTDYVRSYTMPSYTTKASGIDDIEIGTWNYVYLNTGTGWATTTLQTPQYITTGLLSSPNNRWDGYVEFNEPVDWDSDGIPDYAGRTSTTTKPDLLVRVNHPTGGSTDVAYEYSSQSGLNPDLAFPQLLVTSITHDDGFGNQEATSYTYRDGKMYLTGDFRDRRFGGFGEIVKQTALGFVKTFFHQGDTASTTAGELIDDFALIGKPYREDVLTNGSSTLERTFYRWDTDEQQVATTSDNTYALDLESGSSQYASIADASQTGLDITGDITMSAWIKLESFAYEQMQHIISKRQGSGNQRSYNFYLYQNAGSPLMILDTQSDGYAASCAVNVSWTPSTGTWYHVAVTKDGTTVKFYVNGTQQGSTQTCTSATIYNGTAPFQIGALTGESSYFDGIIDDVRIWSRDLAGTEVSDLYVSPVTFANGTDLQGAWHLNNAYTDSSGNGNTLTGNGSPVFTTDVAYAGTFLNSLPGRWFTMLRAEVKEWWEGGASHKDTATEFTYSTSTGNLVLKAERGEVTSSMGSFTDTGTDSRFTIYTYSTTTARNQSLLTYETVKNHASTTVAETRFFYDNAPFASTTKGNLTKEERWISGTTYASSTKSYTRFGMVATTTDPLGNQTQHYFDANNLYVATTSNALGHLTGIVRDYASGKEKSIIDPNGLRRSFTLDAVGRVTTEMQSDIAAPSSLVTSRTHTYTDTFPQSVFTRSYQSSGTSTESYLYRDGLGRKLQERVQWGGANTFAVRDYAYNSAGLLARESLPYFASSSARTTATSTTALFTSYLYDALGRATSSATIVGTTTYARSPWQLQTIDPNGSEKRVTYDAYENLASVIEYLGPTPYTTSYTYDALKNLTKITDAEGNIRNFAFDGLSRRTSAEDLHDTADTTFGTWLYGYDLAGNLSSTTDPKGQNVTYTYDALNRVAAEDYAGSSGTEITYAYDSCPYGTGRMCVASSTEVRTTYAYNVLGLSSAEQSIVNGIGYASTTFDYDRQGNQTSITYPDGRQVLYGYDLGGRIGDIQSKASGGTFAHVLSRAEYSPLSQVMLRQYGNAISIPYSYDANQLYRLARVGDASNSVQDIAYEYDAVGNIVGITDSSPTLAEKTLAFEYDDLHRLTLASTTAASSTPYREVYSYSILGNLLYKRLEAATTSGNTNTYSLDLESGSSQYASISDVSQTGLDITGDITMSAWIKLESFAYEQMQHIISKRQGSGNQRSYNFYLYQNAGSPLMILDTQSDGYAASCAVNVSWTPSTGTWYHVAVTKDGTTVKFYVNGTQQGSTQTCTSATIYNGTAPFQIGALTGESSYFDGIIDDVRIWSRDLAGTEVSDLYVSPVTFANGTDLQGAWHLNNAYTDSSGNGNTLTGNGSPVFATDVPYTGASATGGLGSYAYDETDYANPHAPTGIWDGTATSSIVYDRNGNATQFGTTTAYTWDWRNRMSASGILSATTTYAYDHTEQRRAQRSPSKTFHYPNKYFSIEYQGTSTATATSTSYIWHGDTLVAYIEQAITDGVATGTPTTYYVHPDHLGSTNVVTNAAGQAVQVLDYYPYGDSRIDTGVEDSERQYIGERYDAASGLNYLNARYYDGGRGQFLSLDPAFLLLGEKERTRNEIGSPMEVFLVDPQQQNSFSYGRGSPVTHKDPTGNCAELFSAAFCSAIYYSVIAYNAASISIAASDVYLTNYSDTSESFSNVEQQRSWFSFWYKSANTAVGSLGGPLVGMESFAKTLEALNITLDVLETDFSQLSPDSDIIAPAESAVQDWDQSTILENSRPWVNRQIYQQANGGGNGTAWISTQLQSISRSLESIKKAISNKENEK